MSFNNSFKNSYLQTIQLQIMYIKQELALDNPQELIYPNNNDQPSKKRSKLIIN